MITLKEDIPYYSPVGHSHAVSVPPTPLIELSDRIDELEDGLRETLNILQGTVLAHWDCDCSICAAFRIGKEALDG